MKTVLRRKEGERAEGVRILVSGKLHPVCLETLQNPPPDLTLSVPIILDLRPDCTREELFAALPNADVLLSRSETDVDHAVIEAAPQLSVIARAAVGYGNIDVAEATRKGVLVVNTPGKNTNSAAELTMGLLLEMARHISAADVSMKHGAWDRHRFTGTELCGKRIGIVGIGNVGHRVARFCNGFEMEVFAYDPYVSADVFRRHKATQFQSLDELIASVDILTVHVPLNDETRGMIGARELEKLHMGSWVVNAARGGVVDEDALFECLESGHLAYAGIDTWEGEPRPARRLVEHPRVVATPHIGASTEEAQVRIGQTIAVQILKALRGEIVDFPVNLPNLSVLPDLEARNISVLLEKMGRMLAQLHDFRPKVITLRIPAEVPEKLYELLSISAIKGYLSHTSDDFVSYVNARMLFENRGLSLRLENKEGTDRPSKEILLEIAGDQVCDAVRLGAVLYEGRIPRLTLIDDFELETEPAGELLVVSNEDRPGVIGAVGTFLAQESINIAQFDLSRKQAMSGGKAMSVIRTDGRVPREALGRMEKLPHVLKVRRITGL